MQHNEIPVSPQVHIPMIPGAWRKVHSRCNIFQFLYRFPQFCLTWTLEVTTPMPVQFVPVSAKTCANNYYVTYCKWYLLSFFCISAFAMRLHLVHNIIQSTRLTTYSLLTANMQYAIYDYKHKVVKYHEYTIDYY